MAEIPAEQMAAEESAQKAMLTPFLTKTYQLVDDPSVDDLISWNEDGSGFIIWKPAEFARDLLPKYFKHNNLSSFVRQLNTYGFRKVVPDRWEFSNDFFKKGEKGLLHEIQRRKMTIGGGSSATAPAAEGPSVAQSSKPKSAEEQLISSISSHGGTVQQRQVTDSTAPALVEESEGQGIQQETKSTSPELVEENKRLERENQRMTDELSHLKGLCSNIFSLMSGYGPAGPLDAGNIQDAGNTSMESKQIDFLQSGKFMEEQGGSSGGGGGDKEVEENTSTRLFGVSIGAKRQRRSEEDQGRQRQQQQQQQRQDDTQTESHNCSNTAQSKRKLEPGPS